MKKIGMLLFAIIAIGMVACKGGNQTDKAGAACCADSTACSKNMKACAADAKACCADSMACKMKAGAACCADSAASCKQAGAACCDKAGMKMDAKKVIVARVLVKEGQEAAFIKSATKLVEATRKEDGNLFYTLYQSTENPSVFLFYEEYKNEAAFKAHSESAHFAEFSKATANMLASTLVVDQY